MVRTQQKSLICERLLYVRKKSELSQVDFAKSLGISPGAYKNYELGIRDVPLNVVTAINDVFEVDLHWLVFGEGADSPETSRAVIDQIVHGIHTFEDAEDEKLAPDRESKAFFYLFSQMAKGLITSDQQIQEYLLSTK